MNDLRVLLKYKQEIRKTFVIPFIASAIMGLVIGVLHMLLTDKTGDAVATLISILVGVCVYFVALLKLKGVNEHEIKGFPGGHILAGIARTLRLL